MNNMDIEQFELEFNDCETISDKERYDLIYNEINSLNTYELLQVCGINSVGNITF